jgi:hypothetical protein
MSRPPHDDDVTAGANDNGHGDPGADVLAQLSEMARGQASAASAGVLRLESGLPAWAALRAARAVDERRRRVRALVAGAAVAALLVFGGRGLWMANAAPRLTFAIEGATGTGGYIAGGRAPGGRLAFSDGTVVALEPGSHVWVMSTGAEGARIRIEDGQARFMVRHRPSTHWTVEAGPFVVLVTGTVFEVRWSGAEDLFRVKLYEGSVVVQGPFTGGSVRLAPGQELEAHPGEGTLRIGSALATVSEEPSASETRAPAGAAPPAGIALAAPVSAAPPPAIAALPVRPRPLVSRPPVAAALRAPARAPHAPAPRPAHVVPAPAPAEERPSAPSDVGAGWARDVARGRFELVLRDAAACGPDQCVGVLAADRLSALADAARYAGRPEVARRALLAQRARFAGSDTGQEAAFLLGRLAEGAGSAREALGWYRRYLGEAPAGTFAAEALGRVMLLEHERRDVEAARATARQYLDRFPGGVYAQRAREISGGVGEGAR